MIKTLQSNRLQLRPIELSDLLAIHELHSLPGTNEFNTLGIPKNVKETKSIIDTWVLDNQQEKVKNYTFVIEKVESKQFIGLIALNLSDPKFNKAEIWYKLLTNYWNKGFVTEAVNTIIDFGFNNLNLHRIEAGCAVENIGSIKVLEKVGMTQEGRKRKVLPLEQGWSDNFFYAILKEDRKAQ